MTDDEIGFEVGISKAHCRHCDYERGLNTALWIYWMHLLRHPVVFCRLVWRKVVGDDDE